MTATPVAGEAQAAHLFDCIGRRRYGSASGRYQDALIQPSVGDAHWGVLMIAPDAQEGLLEVFVYVFASPTKAKTWLADARAGYFPWIGEGLQGRVIGRAAMISHEPIRAREASVVAACER